MTMLDDRTPQVAASLKHGKRMRLVTAVLKDSALQDLFKTLFREKGLGHIIATAITGASGLTKMRTGAVEEEWMHAKAEFEAKVTAFKGKSDDDSLEVRAYRMAKDEAEALAWRWKTVSKGDLQLSEISILSLIHI